MLLRQLRLSPPPMWKPVLNMAPLSLPSPFRFISLAVMTLVALAGNFILSLLPDSIIAALNYLLPALFGAMCMQRIMMDYKSAFVLLPCALIIRYLSTLGVFKVLPFGGGYAPILSCVIIGVVVAKALHGKAAAKPKA